MTKRLATNETAAGLRQVSRNSHVYEVTSNRGSADQWVFACPDIHWDNPKCDRDLLRRHLDQAVERNARIIMPGDTFCLMQGNYDPRKAKSDIRPEHNVNDYLDEIVRSAAEWFAPWKEHIDVVGLGNHETSILKRAETDIVGRFVQALNMQGEKTDHRVMAGGYGGWYTVRFACGGSSKSFKIKYFHGSGGGGPVTKGTIQHNRQSTHVEGADCILMGHVHEDYEVTYSREYLDHNLKPSKRDVLMVRASTYKEEFVDGYAGWHVETGKGPRPIGGRFIHINYHKGWSERKKTGAKAKEPSIVAYSHRAV